MYQPSTNITQKYRQETRYNYMGNSGFVAQIAFFFVLRFCAIVSLVLHLPHKFLRKRYRKLTGFASCFCAIVSLVLHLPHKFLRKCYHKATGFLLFSAFVLSFRYHYTYRTNSCGNAIANKKIKLEIA